MLVVAPFSESDFLQSIQLHKWISELDRTLNHPLLLLSSPGITDAQMKQVFEISRPVFSKVSTIRQRGHDPKKWPQGPNQMFKTAVEWVKQFNPGPFLWLEPDCVPTQTGWIDKLEHDYKVRGKPFYGTLYDKPMRHFNGVCIYPPNISAYNPSMLGAVETSFDCVRPELTIKYGYNSPLMQRSLADPRTNTPHTFPDKQSLQVIKPGVILFHGCKDRSLIERFREHRNGHMVRPSIPVQAKAWLNRLSFKIKKGKRKKIDLSNVTLWSACWSDDRALLIKTIRVLGYCSAIFKFQRIVLFSYLPPPSVSFSLDLIQIPKLNLEGWNILINRVVPLAIDSEFAMCVHEDGFPINPEMWTKEFLGYDYIGAPWKDGVVGNGGFYIESQRMMKEKLQLPFNQDPIGPADYYVCRVHRKRLEQRGIVFAPVDLATRFSTETTGHGTKSFGFHGRNHNPEAYKTGWERIQAFEQQPEVSVVVVYVHVPNDPQHVTWAKEFVASYRTFPPGYNHRTIVVCQNGKPDSSLFAALPGVQYFDHDDVGFDVGAYLALSKKVNDDFMVCFGGSTYFQKPDWLARMVQAWKRYGPGLYGATATYEVSPHLNTTAFWCDPNLLRQYPVKVITRQERYDFEHGPNAFWKFVDNMGLPVKLVTWCGEYDWPQWRLPENLFRRGDQTNCLACWHHHRKYEQALPPLKRAMERNSDIIIDPLYLPSPKADAAIKSREMFITAHQGFV